VELTRVSFGYHPDRPVICDVSFQLEEGERVALLGPNGAGKSTLLLQFNGLLRGTGRVRIDNLDVTPPHLAQVRGKVGMVFQDPDDQLFCATIYEDVAYGLHFQGLSPGEIDRRVRQALEEVGLADCANRAPHELSGGEKKRAAMATVLSMEPRLLVLDEPTAGLDARARRSVISVLQKRSQAMLVATHDLQLVEELLPRSLLLDGGRLEADLPSTELLLDRARLERHGVVA
jgi:energy-coupling factor transporter ATP-binding protein EcfA2